MPSPADTLAELWSELDRGRIIEATIRASDAHVDGLCIFPDAIYVNPAPAIVLTLLHELMHRRYPAWSERRVDRESRRMMGHLTHADLQRWYRAYQRAMRTRKRPIKAD